MNALTEFVFCLTRLLNLLSLLCKDQLLFSITFPLFTCLLPPITNRLQRVLTPLAISTNTAAPVVTTFFKGFFTI